MAYGEERFPIRLSFPRDEYDQVQKAAQKAGLSMSEFCRLAALKAISAKAASNQAKVPVLYEKIEPLLDSLHAWGLEHKSAISPLAIKALAAQLRHWFKEVPVLLKKAEPILAELNEWGRAQEAQKSPNQLRKIAVRLLRILMPRGEKPTKEMSWERGAARGGRRRPAPPK
jgi:hypothetical protein